MKFLFLCFMTFGSVAIVLAQECPYSLSGTVIDFHDKTPLAGASVVVTGLDRQVTTDASGRFYIDDLCEGFVELEVSHPECISRFVRADVEDEESFIKITLEHHLEELEEVQVVGSAIKERTNSSQEETILSTDLERYTGNSIGDALKRITGVSSLNTGAAIVKPVVQGLSGSRVTILNNGVRMQDMEWGDEHAPNIDINLAGKTTLIKGAGALQYGGDAIGGVILVEPEKIRAQDSLYGKVLLNGVTNGRGGSGTLELTKSYKNGWFIKGQASYKRFGDLEAPDYILSNTGIAQIGASFSLGKNSFEEGWEAYYSFFDSDIAILRASHIGNVDDLIQAINSQTPNVVEDFTYTIGSPSQEVTHHLAKGSYYKRFEGAGKLSLQYDFQQNQRFEYDLRRGETRDIPSIDLRLTTHTISTDFRADASEQNRIHLGLMARYQNNSADPSTGVRRLIPDYDRYDFGAFALTEYYVSPSWVIDAGLRYDFSRIDARKFYQASRWAERGYDIDFNDLIIEDLGSQLLTNPVLDYHNFSATAGVEHTFGEDSKVRANYALAQRAPNPSELFSEGLHHSAARIELGDLRITSETSHKIAVSVEKDSEKWGYVLAPYVNRINDFVLLEPSGVEFTIRGAFPVWTYRQTDAIFAGIDASLYSQWTPTWRSEHRFSFIKGKDETLEGPLINVPPVHLENGLVYQNPQLRKLRIAVESRYVFRQNEFPENIEVFSPVANEQVVLDINTPPPAYHLLDLDLETRLTLIANNDLTLGLRVTNVFNTRYRDYLNRLRFFADDLGRNLALRIKWII
ncbi:TonB-dependent receptor [Flavobacteriaceae bacterium TP-CH-4]|uniref:TonB-dependent receptor n=1 Tax=Pelagihabitans pacificus TaxID=2696054 RepID=A0A967E7F9_9FLAO|nr:TonB-dependent receptor [Pelagihabitans pacificus]NHF60214.1 TonB-dependent receptor [Pelagihabitans pacificus]